MSWWLAMTAHSDRETVMSTPTVRIEGGARSDPDPVGVLKNAELALYLALIPGHWKHTPSHIRRLSDVFREVVQIY